MKKKNKKKIFIASFFLIICFALFTYSVIKIILWKNDSNDTSRQIDIINNLVEVKEVENNVEIIKSETESDYWKYTRMKLINVNFTELKKTNKDTKGWLQVNGTNVNYPFVQAKDNSFYLSHSFDKTKNSAGWVFLDYRNNINKLDKNTILYAHGRYDKTMFGSLRNIESNGWLKNSDNFIIKLSTESSNTLWQVFSVYKIVTTGDYIQVSFNNNDEFITLVNKLIKRSSYDFKTSVGTDDKILTLSTCYDKTRKLVVHAKLIKIEKK